MLDLRPISQDEVCDYFCRTAGCHKTDLLRYQAHMTLSAVSGAATRINIRYFCPECGYAWPDDIWTHL